MNLEELKLKASYAADDYHVAVGVAESIVRDLIALGGKPKAAAASRAARQTA